MLVHLRPSVCLSEYAPKIEGPTFSWKLQPAGTKPHATLPMSSCKLGQVTQGSPAHTRARRCAARARRLASQRKQETTPEGG